MVKNRFRVYGLLAVGLVGLISSCSGSSNPAAPTSATGLLSDLQFALPPDGVVSLKVPAPIPQSPAFNAETDDLTPTLIASNSDPSYVSGDGFDFTYDFEIYKVATGGVTTKVGTTRSVAQAPTTTSYTVPAGDLVQDTSYTWRTRVRIGDEHGAWSDAATFRTPTLVTVDAPILLSPADGAEVSTTRPQLTVTNGAVSADAGAVQYDFQLDDEGATFPNPVTFSVSRSGGTTTSARYENALARNQQFWWRARATNGTVTSEWTAPFSFTVSATSSSGPRTPDPAPGQSLPLPNESALIAAMASTHAVELADSCIEEGGSWDFMDEAVRQLRLKDTRWGYNCKRGNCNHISIDVVDYFYGIGDGTDSTEVYIIDIISAVCPDGDQDWSWQDQTDATHEEGAIGRWIYPRP